MQQHLTKRFGQGVWLLVQIKTKVIKLDENFSQQSFDLAKFGYTAHDVVEVLRAQSRAYVLPALEEELVLLDLGLELALAGSSIFAATGAQFGQPEMNLGVFAPAASVLLPGRIGQTAAEDLLFSGRSVTSKEAQAMGLVQTVAEDPEAAALSHFDQYFAGKSAASLAFAVVAVRDAMVRQFAGRNIETDHWIVPVQSGGAHVVSRE